MRALRCEGRGRVVIVDVPEPVPRDGDAVVRIEASAVCGSERPTFIEGANDGAPNAGHEACGIVLEPGTSSFSAGDRVGLSGVAGCDECDRCLAGQEIHCRRGWTYAAAAGWHAELAVLPGSCLVGLPSETRPVVGALIVGDTLGVAARAFRRDPTGPGDSVVVFGLGPVGLGHVAVRAFTGADVVAVEPSAYRRALALSLGAVAAIAPGDALDVTPRVVIECSGHPECVTQSIEIVDNGGVVHQSGLCHSTVSINPMAFFEREIAYTGDMYFAREDHATMLDLVERRLPLERICTHEVVAAEAQAAVTDFLEARSGKIVLRWDEHEL
jgi:L-iditol 2-dehydrogenase